MSGEAIQIGPFLGGLNTYSDETSVADNELVACDNFELDLDGSLKSRPPFYDQGVTFPLGESGNIELLDYYYAPGEVPYLIATDGLSKTYFYSGNAWELLTDKFAASAMTQFDGEAWLLAPVGSSQPGGRWSPAGGFTAEPNMPRGNVIVAHKFRLWVSPGAGAADSDLLYYSNVSNPADPIQLPIWQATPDRMSVGGGDGQGIVQVTLYYNNLLIFRNDSIYSFSYSTTPGTGILSQVVPGVGLTHRDTLVAYENYVYFMYNDRAYEFINSRATQINVKVPFRSSSRVGIYKPYSVSLFNNRVIFSYWDMLYVFSLRTRTWTTWTSTKWGAIGKILRLNVNSQYEEAILHSSLGVPQGGLRVATTLFLTDGVTTASEEMVCMMQTKNYNYEVSSAYKRLFWWGVDAGFRGEVRALVTPITFNYQVTWGQLLETTWGDLLNYTWSMPTSGNLSVETVRSTLGSGSSRKFVKFLKALRFRQVYFKLTFDTDGSLDTAPVRVFTLMSYVRAKERVSKAIT